jgi:aspartyl-tRNA(Asn)/glutamyl-tRNA(Gln) amidotransferase subunit A
MDHGARELDGDVNSVVTWLPPSPDGEAGPLAGLTVGVKDNIAVRGAPTTCGSDFFLGHVAGEDATVVAALRRAGAKVTATLNMAEWAVGVTSQNSVHGGPRNPWDPERVPGGSSGGSGAAVAAGLVDVALGTDTGGSIRLPAAACGVTGLRPTPGSIDMSGIVPVSRDFDTVGPLARDVVLVEAVHDVLRTAPAPAVDPPTRIGVPDVFVTDDIDPGVSRAVAACVEQLRALGYEIVPVTIPGDTEAQRAVYTFIYTDLVAFHRERLRSAPERFQPDTLERLRLGLELDADDLAEARRVRDSFRAGMSRVFDDVDAVITPTLPVDVPRVAGGDDNLTTLALPVGIHEVSGMPIGAQVTAAAHHEAALFAIGRAFQDATTWHTLRPPLSL